MATRNSWKGGAEICELLSTGRPSAGVENVASAKQAY